MRIEDFDSNNLHPVFVYGTLRFNQGNWQWALKDAQYLDTVTLRGFTMLDLGPFPGVVNGNHQVVGELYLIDDESLAALDRLEGHPHHYKRVWVNEVPSPYLDADGFWIYIYQQRDPEDTVIPHGDWLRHVQES